ncbi:hypothetical protein [Winogradskya humida]|nr:hypothetical protein [Actinoplanes humidus]
MTFPIESDGSPVPGQDIDAELTQFAELGLIRRWRPHGPAKGYVVVTGNVEILLHDPGQARAFIAGLRAMVYSTRRTEFLELVSAAVAMQDKAERLCDEATESGLENDEFAVREAADELRARALGIAEVILGVP